MINDQQYEEGRWGLQERWFFMGQVPDLCNSLPKGVVEVTSLCVFKGRLEKFLGEESTGGS